MVANGTVQRTYIDKNSIASPTLHLESILTLLVVDVYESCVATIDIGGESLLFNIATFVLVKLHRDLIKVIHNTNPGYKKYVTKRGKKPILCMELRKTLYSILCKEKFYGMKTLPC